MLIMVMISLGILVGYTWSQESENATTAIYIVTLKQAPASHSYDVLLKVKGNHSKIGGGSGSGRKNELVSPRYCFLLQL